MSAQQNGSETFVVFELAGTAYAVHSRRVQQMEMIEHITPVPNAPPAVEGVVFSRGRVVPAINLRVRFGFERIPFDPRTRLVVVDLSGRAVGLIVDTAREFIAIATDAIQPPNEAISGLSGKYLEGIATLGDRIILILNLDEVVNLAEIITGDQPSALGALIVKWGGEFFMATPAFDTRSELDGGMGQVREQAEQVTRAAAEITRIAEQVAQGAEAQVQSLDKAVGSANEMAALLKETTAQAESVATSTEELVSTVNEMAASIEQVTANTVNLASAVTQTATSIKQTSASIQNVTSTAQEMATSAQQVTAAMNEIASSVSSVSGAVPDSVFTVTRGL